MYADLPSNIGNGSYFANYKLLTVLNKDVYIIGEIMTPRYSTIANQPIHHLRAWDSYNDLVPDNHLLSSPEYYFNQDDGKIPPPILDICIDMPVIMLRNIRPPEGAMNGVVYIVKHIAHTILRLEVADGARKGQVFLCPRIFFCHPDFPYVRRLQFPIRHAFALTIDKSQGLSFDSVGIYLPSQPFAHGQTYVAVSRGRSKNKLTILSLPDPTKMKNIVLKAAFPKI